jgi:hypothetical protein
MTNQQLLHDLDRRHARIEQALADLKTDLQELHTRLDAPEKIIPSVDVTPPPAFFPAPIRLPELPAIPVATVSEPVVPAEEVPLPFAATFTAPEPSVLMERPNFELRFGKWLASIGVVFALLTLVYFSILVHNTLYQYLGPWSKLTVLTLVSGALIATGLRLESRDSKLLVYGRTLAGGGLACLYYTLYGATYVPQLHVIPSPLFGGMLLLAWSAGVLFIAERRKSELLSIFALSLAYFSSAITPGNGFTIAADLILALTAVTFLVRNAWAGLSYLCLLGTYAGFLRQAVVYNGPLDFQWIGTLPFWPSAVYLTGAWLIFTAGILLSRTPDFVNEKRMAFLCLNNGAWVGLLVLASHLGSFGHWGGILGTVGAAFLAAYVIAKITRTESRDLASAYLTQGLLFATGGVVVAYSGVTRGLLITIESVFLVASGAFSRNLILRFGGALCSVLGAGFLASEIAMNDLHAWVLTFTGAIAMLANAWLVRREFWSEQLEKTNSRFVVSSAMHALLAIGLLAAGIFCHAQDDWVAPDLALATLILSASVYVVPIFELPLLSQVLLVIAQILSFGFVIIAQNGTDFGYLRFEQSQWNHNFVALATMLLVTWFPWQKRVRIEGWFTPLSGVYALAMVAYCYDLVHPHASAQTWMISAALLSLVFLGYGAWSRLWAFMGAGQILLAMSVFTFLNTADISVFPWTWWAAVVPIGIVFATGWFVREVLPRHVKAVKRKAQFSPSSRAFIKASPSDCSSAGFSVWRLPRR